MSKLLSFFVFLTSLGLVFLPQTTYAGSVSGPVNGAYGYISDDGSSYTFRENNGKLEYKQGTDWVAEDKITGAPADVAEIESGFIEVKNHIQKNAKQSANSQKTAPQIELDNPLKINSLKELITTSIPEFLIMFIGFVSLIMFFLGAVRYLWAGSTAMGGNDGKQVISDAKSAMVGSIIGLVIALLAYGILATLKRLLGA